MSRTRAARRRSARPAAPLQPAGPTPETRAKLRRDLLESLFAKGRLRREHIDAGEEIRRIWEAMARGLSPSATDPTTLAMPPRPSRTIFQPVDLLSPAEEAIWRRRYRRWADETSRVVCPGTVGVRRLRVVIDLAVDNRGLREVEGDPEAGSREEVRRRHPGHRSGGRKDAVGQCRPAAERLTSGRFQIPRGSGLFRDD